MREHIAWRNRTEKVADELKKSMHVVSLEDLKLLPFYEGLLEKILQDPKFKTERTIIEMKKFLEDNKSTVESMRKQMEEEHKKSFEQFKERNEEEKKRLKDDARKQVWYLIIGVVASSVLGVILGIVVTKLDII